MKKYGGIDFYEAQEGLSLRFTRLKKAFLYV